MTPAEGSDLDKVVRPLSRGRKTILYLFVHRSSALRALTCAYLTRTPQPGSFPIDKNGAPPWKNICNFALYK